MAPRKILFKRRRSRLKIPKVPAWRSPWIVAAFAFAGWIGSIMLPNAKEVISNVDSAYKYAADIYYGDSYWMGLWTTSTEYFLDSPQDGPDSDVRLFLSTDRGDVDGVISTESICNKVQLFDYFLVEGKVNGSTADLVAYDFLAGERREFFRFKVERLKATGEIVVEQVNGQDWIKGKHKLPRRPESDQDEMFQLLTGYCGNSKGISYGRLPGRMPDTKKRVPIGQRHSP